MAVFVPPFKDPQLLNWAKQVNNRLGASTGGNQVGQGKPQVKKSDVQGDTYWNKTDNNFWLFDQGAWTRLDNGLNVNRVTGQITTYTGELHSWLYRYIHIKYADSEDGMQGFSDYPTGHKYYGLLNTDDATESTDPTKYIWSNVDIPNDIFGPKVFFWYETQGGRQWKQFVGSSQPDGNYTTAPVSAIDLDVITTALGPVSVDGPQAIRYSNSIDGLTDFSSTATNRSFIGYWSKAEHDAASAAEQENPMNYTWKTLPATVGVDESVFVATGQGGSLIFEVGAASSDPTKFSDLGFQNTPTQPALDPNARSGYVVTKMVASAAGGAINYGNQGSPISGTGSVTIALPSVGMQGTYDSRSFPFITIDQYGRVVRLSQSAEEVEYFFVDSTTATYSGSQTITYTHIVGQVLVFLNGCLLKPTTDFTETATGVTIPGWSTGESVTVIRFRKITGLTTQDDSIPFTRNDFTIATDTNSFNLPAGLDPQTEFIYLNGVLLPDAEYTYATAAGNDVIQLIDPTQSIKAGTEVTVVAYAKVNTIIKFNQETQYSVEAQTQYTYTTAPRPNTIIPTALVYILNYTINGVTIDETSDYVWPRGSRTVTLTTASTGSNAPEQYNVWVGDLAYPT